MNFVCRNRLNPAAYLIIRADSWMDARSYAARVFGCEPNGVDADHVRAQRRADVELRWTGSDAGRLAGRRLEVRERDAVGKWTAWRAA